MPAPRQQLTQPLNRPSPVLPAKAGSTPVLYSPQGGRCSDAEFQRSTRHARNETIAANVFPGRSIPARRLDRLRLRVRLAVELHIRNARVHKCTNRRITCLAWFEPHLPHHRHMRHSTRPRIQKIGSAASKRRRRRHRGRMLCCRFGAVRFTQQATPRLSRSGIRHHLLYLARLRRHRADAPVPRVDEGVRPDGAEKDHHLRRMRFRTRYCAHILAQFHSADAARAYAGGRWRLRCALRLPHGKAIRWR